MDRIRWGILGTGRIAGLFALDLANLAEAELVAVGSRSQATADLFGDRFDVPHRHPSYEALAADADVDVVYVATPHNLHHDNTSLCLDQGKAVLCEKPFAINAAEAETMIALARQKGLFLMEAMWTRFLPLMVRVRGLLAEGILGEPRLLTADFGFRTALDPLHRLFDPHLGGGALLDVGVYLVSLASMIFGEPAEVHSLAELGKTGVDEQAGMLFGYEGGQLASLVTAIRTRTPHEATLFGTDGWLRIHREWWHPSALTLSIGGEDELIEAPIEGIGYQYEAAETMRCLREGRLESEIMPLDETLSIMRTLDAIRGQWGLVYPMEA